MNKCIISVKSGHEDKIPENWKRLVLKAPGVTGKEGYSKITG